MIFYLHRHFRQNRRKTSSRAGARSSWPAARPAGAWAGYAVNALGGAAGCILAGFVTIGWLGLRGSLLLGVGLNLLAASLAYALARRRPSSEPPASGAAPPAPAPAVRASSGLLAAFFLAGLTGLAAEVVWTRMLLLNIDSTAQSFAAMLAVCLLGLSLGSIATSRTAARADPVRAYGLTLALVGLSILLGMALWATLGTSTAEKLVQGSARPKEVRAFVEKAMQNNWIGKSLGVEIHFKVKKTLEPLLVFTTRPDTIFGATYVVLAPEHPLVEKLVQGSARPKEVRAFVEKLDEP